MRYSLKEKNAGPGQRANRAANSHAFGWLHSLYGQNRQSLLAL